MLGRDALGHSAAGSPGCPRGVGFSSSTYTLRGHSGHPAGDVSLAAIAKEYQVPATWRGHELHCRGGKGWPTVGSLSHPGLGSPEILPNSAPWGMLPDSLNPKRDPDEPPPHVATFASWGDMAGGGENLRGRDSLG